MAHVQELLCEFSIFLDILYIDPLCVCVFYYIFNVGQWTLCMNKLFDLDFGIGLHVLTIGRFYIRIMNNCSIE